MGLGTSEAPLPTTAVTNNARAKSNHGESEIASHGCFSKSGRRGGRAKRGPRGAFSHYIDHKMIPLTSHSSQDQPPNFTQLHLTIPRCLRNKRPSPSTPRIAQRPHLPQVTMLNADPQRMLYKKGRFFRKRPGTRHLQAQLCKWGRGVLVG